MGYIAKGIEIQGDKGKTSILALFDTGAAQSLIRREKVQDIATTVRLPWPLTFKLGDGEATLVAEESATLFLTINGITINDQVLVVDKLAADMIVGAHTMQGWRIKLDLEKEEVIVDPSVTRLRL